MSVKTKQFASGLRLVAKQMKGIYSFSLGVMVGVGSRNEDLSTNGYSHFIEHMSFKGTTTRTALDISKEMDAMGGDINAYTSKDVTCYYTRAGNQYLDNCFNLLSDMFFNASFPNDELENEKKVICEEISIDQDSPEDLCGELITQSLYGNATYGLPVLGTVKNVMQATRNSLLSFKDKYYIAGNTVITIAGNFDYEKVCQLAEEYFDKFFSNKSISPILTVEEPKFNKDFLYTFKDVEQAHLTLAYPCPDNDNAYVSACAVAASVLGGNMSSRLFQEIREKAGLAYSVYSFFSNYKECGYFQIYLGTNPKNISKASQMLKLHLTQFAQKGITTEELELTKSQIVGSTQLAQESTMTLMRVFGSTMLRRNKPYSIKENLKQYASLTLDFVNQTISNLFSTTPASAYVGKKTKDYDEISKIIPSN